MLEKRLRKAIRNIIEENYIKDVTAMEIIGKKMGEVFSGPGSLQLDGRTITYAKLFGGGSDFSAYYSAKEYLRMEGYESGSMYLNHPIAFMLKGKTKLDNRGNTMIVTKWDEERPLLITKFDALSQENIDELDGVIIPAPGGSTMRDGNVFVVFFVFPD